MNDRTAQHELSDFLQSELYHTIGSYGVATQRLSELKARMADRDGPDKEGVPWKRPISDEDLSRACDYNILLRDLAHKPAGLRNDYSKLQRDGRRKPPKGIVPPRHPAPEQGFHKPDEKHHHYRWVLDFYATAAEALKSLGNDKSDPSELDPPDIDPNDKAGPKELKRLGRLLDVVHDPQRRGGPGRSPSALHKRDPNVVQTEDYAERVSLRGGRIKRYESRLKQAEDCLGVASKNNRTRSILKDHLGAGAHSDDDPLHLYAVGAFVEAHLRMHYAEHLLSHNFSDKTRLRRQIDDKVTEQLEISIVLNTFVYAVGRSTPWIFSQDKSERQYLTNPKTYEQYYETVTPLYCLWPAHQLSLLALHRRAYAYWLLGEKEKAYKDFFKLKRFIRALERQLVERISQAPGTMIFLDGLYALAEHHTGEVYRAEHAYTAALRHFKRASARLERLEPRGRRLGEIADGRDNREVSEVLRNSRWRVHLLISQGQAHYELGKVKSSLLCYVLAWKAFLELGGTENKPRPNYEVIDHLLRWLELVEHDPDVNKVEISKRFAPLVEQFQGVRGPVHLQLLVAEIMLRLGHVLYILKLPPKDLPYLAKRDGVADDSLAYRCLCKAAELDRWNTLINADLLKIKQRRRRSGGLERYDTVSEPKVARLEKQWAAGGSEFEEAARVIEYVLQIWLDDDHDNEPSENDTVGTDGEGTEAEKRDEQDKKIARDLLAAFLTHTDSSNVKLAQVYRYLMQESDYAYEELSESESMLKVVCMRRYSSFFPFLPRPSAFRVLGGGYFVRVYDRPAATADDGVSDEGNSSNGPSKVKPFGIVIDPGPDFLGNLYRCGYCLDDVHLVIVTHDHADHITELDAMLTLIGYRGRLGAPRFGGEGHQQHLAIVGNKSVCDRYSFFNEADRKDFVWVFSFDQFEKITACQDQDARGRLVNALVGKERKVRVDLPLTLRIKPVQTKNHNDVRNELSQGFLLSVGDEDSGSCVFFTSDTELPDAASNSEAEQNSGDGEQPGKDAALPAKQASQVVGFNDAIAQSDVVVAHLSSVPLPELRKLAKFDKAPRHAQKPTDLFQELWKLMHQDADPTKKESSPERQSSGVGDESRFSQRRRLLPGQLQFGFRTEGKKPPSSQGSALESTGEKSGSARPPTTYSQADRRYMAQRVSPLNPLAEISDSSIEPKKHLYLGGLLQIARQMVATEGPRLLLIGELREELGSFRTRIASKLNQEIFEKENSGKELQSRALTTDVGLEVRIQAKEVKVLCSTCALDNDLVDDERFHAPRHIYEVCVKGEDEGIFYNCTSHDPQMQLEPTWTEEVERIDLFGR